MSSFSASEREQGSGIELQNLSYSCCATSLEGIDLAPELDDLFLLLRKVELGADWMRDQRVWRVPGQINGTHDRVQGTT